MKFLLDTHILLWALMDHEKLSSTLKEKICDETNIIFVSAVSTWEIMIKKSLGKLKIPNNFESALVEARFELLPIRVSHTMEIENLPEIHSDPFDRLLIAQCKIEGLTLITQDKTIMKYDNISILWN